MDSSDCGAASRYGESPVGDAPLEGRLSGRRQSPLWPFKPVGQAGLKASQFQASPWVVQVLRVVSKSVFPSGSLHSPPSSLPSPSLRSWHPAGRSHFMPTLLLQGFFRAWLGLSGAPWLLGLRRANQPRSQKARPPQAVGRGLLSLRKALAPNPNIRLASSGLWALLSSPDAAGAR